MAKDENLHKRLVRAAAERAGMEITEYPRRGAWRLTLPDGVAWEVSWLKSGYFAGARNGAVSYRPDYRTHAYTSTPREILNRWLEREFPPEANQ